LLACAALCFALWAWLILAISLDTTIWNFIFCIINTVQALILLFAKRPIKFKESPHEQIYQEMFARVGVSRHDFREMTKVSHLRVLKAGSYYIEAGNPVSNLSLLYKGKLELFQRYHNRAQAINECLQWEFVESPEWVARRIRRAKLQADPTGASPKGNFFQQVDAADDDSLFLPQDAEIIEVSAKAKENCYFLTWPVEVLDAFLSSHKHIESPLNALVGADIATKLFRQHPQHQKTAEYSSTETFLIDLFKTRLPGFEKMNTGDLVTSVRAQSFRRPGSIFVRAGEEATHLGILKTGEMEVVSGEGSDEKVVYTIHPPELLASVEFGGDHVARHTIRSRVPCTFLVWDAQNLKELCNNHGAVHRVVNAMLAADLATKMGAAWNPNQDCTVVVVSENKSHET
jgi:CRP-like cAMP-binding protein